jgi:hypothetical protein
VVIVVDITGSLLVGGHAMPGVVLWGRVLRRAGAVRCACP